MKYSLVGVALSLALAAPGCGDAAEESVEGGAPRGGLPSPCEGVPSETPLGWDEPSALGVSPQQAFAPVAGSCEAPFSWDASSTELVVRPVTGASRMAVRVTIDEGSARLIDPPGSIEFFPCGLSLAVDAAVELESDDGVFSEHERVTLRYTKERGVAPFRFTRAADALGGSLQIVADGKQQQIGLQYSASGAGDACAGELFLSWTVQTPLGNMGGSGTEGILGGWSNTGCPLGREALRLDDSSTLGATIRRELEDQWSSASFPGDWQGGASAELELAVTIAAEQACAEMAGLGHVEGRGHVEVPVRLSYGTRDGRIQQHATDAHVNVFRSGEDVTQLQLVLSETMTCEPNATRFAHLDERCSAFARAEAQLSLNHYRGPSENSSGTALELYKYVHEEPGSAADAVERLLLRPYD